jgi:hypothetical protein
MAAIFQSGPCSLRYSPASQYGGSGTSALGTTAPSYSDIGYSKDGIRVRQQLHHQEIRTDQGGMGIVNGVCMGQTIYAEFSHVSYSKIKAAIAAHSPTGVLYTNVGKLLTHLAGPLVITPLAGTPWATELGVGKSRILYKALLVTDVDYLMGAGYSEGRCTFLALPDDGVSDKIWEDLNTPA